MAGEVPIWVPNKDQLNTGWEVDEETLGGRRGLAAFTQQDYDDSAIQAAREFAKSHEPVDQADFIDLGLVPKSAHRIGRFEDPESPTGLSYVFATSDEKLLKVAVFPNPTESN